MKVIKRGSSVTAFLLVCWFPVTLWAVSLNDAYKHYLSGNYPEAIAKAKRMGDSNDVLYFLAITNIKTGQYEEARFYLRKLLRQSDDASWKQMALLKLVDSYFLEENYVKAKPLYEEIKDTYPLSSYLPVVYLRLAQIAAKQGLWDDKRKYLKILREKYPQSGELRFAPVLDRYDDFFTVQLGVFSERQNAVALKEELRDKKYDNVYVDEEKTDNQLIYKVKLGKFKQRRDAENLLSQVSEQGYSARIYP